MTTPNQLVRRALSFGIKAPNPHNTQAWKFRILDSNSFFLYVDEKRLLLASDPRTRQIHIGQGTFIESLAIGMSGEGYETIVDYFPDGVYRINECGKKPVAKITLVKKGGLKHDALFDTIPQRYTNRKKYKGPLISGAEFTEMKTLVGTSHSEVVAVGNEGDIKRYTDIAREAFRIDLDFDDAYEETWDWLRKNNREIDEYKDGLSLPGLGYGGLFLKLAERSVSTHEKYLSERTRKQTTNTLIKNMVPKGLLFIKTSSDTPIDWVTSGRDYARLNLAANQIGLVMHPLSQVLQEYPAMDSLRAEFEELAGQQGSEKIQMFVRVGRAEQSFRAPRRNVESMLI
ncbi:MAG: Acg family FMN-binding oxidoreductase [Halobacteriota archaeon]